MFCIFLDGVLRLWSGRISVCMCKPHNIPEDGVFKLRDWKKLSIKALKFCEYLTALWMAMWLAWPLTPLPSKVSTWNNKISHCVGVKPESGYLKVNLNKRRQRQRERFFLVWWMGVCVWLWSCLAADNWYLKTFFCLHACTPEKASEKKNQVKGQEKVLD